MAAGLSPTTLMRLDYEFKFKGVAEAVRRYFQSTNLDIEYRKRHDLLFSHMTMPRMRPYGASSAPRQPRRIDVTLRYQYT